MVHIVVLDLDVVRLHYIVTSEQETKWVTSDHPAGVGGLSVRPVGTCDYPIVLSQTIFKKIEV